MPDNNVVDSTKDSQVIENIRQTLSDLISSGTDTSDVVQLINDIIKIIRQNDGSVKNISDVYHTFEELYQQRVIHVALLCNAYPELCYKSKKHFAEETDPMFNGDFMVGIKTPLGVVTYHFKLAYWDLFLIKELERGYPYDGHSPQEDLPRLLSLIKKA